jgi:surface protein
MNTMFYFATAFNQNIGGWNVASVSDMSSAFNGAAAFNQSIASWSTAAATTTASMFQSASAFNQNIAGWNVASVASMLSMFNSATAFDKNLASWNVLRVNAAGWATTWTGAGLSNCNRGAMYTAWGSSFQGVWPAYASYACVVGSVCATCITNGNVAAAVTAWIGNDATTYGNIADWNTAAVTDMANLFNAKPTFNADISKWNVASVSSMHQVDPSVTCTKRRALYAAPSSVGISVRHFLALHLDRRGPTHFAAPARLVDPACTALTVGAQAHAARAL